MRLLLFSDLHGDWKALDRLLSIEADYYIAAGDLSTFNRGLGEIGTRLQAKAPRVYVLPGNHESEADVERFCGAYGLNPFHGQIVEMGGKQIAGLGYSNLTPFQTPGEYTEEQFAQRLAAFRGLKPLVLVCHCPPKDTALDRAGEGRHFGSPAIREFLETEQPEHFFCGHIHEAEGAQVRLGTTVGVNLGKRGYLLEW
jgi:Icc-related predicted phosphoesterase